MVTLLSFFQLIEVQIFTGIQGCRLRRCLRSIRAGGREEGFRALKSDMAIDPVYHSKDMRIGIHTVMVFLGCLLMSLLRAILVTQASTQEALRKGIEHSFARAIGDAKIGECCGVIL